MTQNAALKYLKIIPGEAASAFLLFSVFFLTAFGSCLGLNTCESLFIKYYGVSNIPYAFTAAAISTVFFSMILNAIDHYVPPVFMTVGIILSSAVLLNLSAFGIKNGPYPHLSAFLLFVLTYLVFLTVKSYIIKITEMVLERRQFKRLFPFIASGATLGLALGGFATGSLIRMTGSKTALTFLWTILLIISLGLIIIILKTNPASKPDAQKNHEKSIKRPGLFDGFSNMTKSKLYLFLVLFTLIFNFAVMHFDYIYIFTVKQLSTIGENAGNPDYIASTFGMVRGYSTMITFIIQFFFTSRLIAFAGITNLLFFFPGIFLASFAGVAAKLNGLNAFIGRYAYYISKEAIHVPAFQPLFNALSEKIKNGAVMFVNNVAGAFGMVAANVFLITTVTRGILTVKDSAMTGIVLSALLLILAAMIKHEYVQELLKNITESSPKQLDMLQAVRNLNEKTTIESMKNLLKSRDRDLIVFALESLKNLSAKPEKQLINDLIKTHNDPLITEKLFEFLNGFYVKSFTETIRERFSTLSQKNQILFIKYLHSLKDKSEEKSPRKSNTDQSRLTELIIQYTNHPEPAVFASAAAVLLKGYGKQYTEKFEEFLKEKIQNTSHKNAVIILETVKQENRFFAALLAESLAEDFFNSQICSEKDQKAFIHAAVSLPSETLFKKMISYTAHHRSFTKALTDALTYIKDKELSLKLCQIILNTILSEDRSPRYTFGIQALTALPFISREVIPVFMTYLTNCHDTVYLNLKIVKKFQDLTKDFHDHESRTLEHFVSEEYEELLKDKQAGRTFENQEKRTYGIVNEELKKQVRLRFELILHTFNAITYKTDIRSALTGLLGHDENVRSAAIETIENLIDKKIFRKYLPVLENGPDNWYMDSDETFLQKIKTHPPDQAAAEAAERLLKSGSLWHNLLAVFLIQEKNTRKLPTTSYKSLKKLIKEKKHTSALWIELTKDLK